MKKIQSIQGKLGLSHPLLKAETEKRLSLYRILIKNNFKDIHCSPRQGLK